MFCASRKKGTEAMHDPFARAMSRRPGLLRRSRQEASRIPRIEPDCSDHRVCVALCPEAALTGFELDDRRGVALRLESCTGCGRCAERCPERAIELVPRPAGVHGLLPLSAHEPRICTQCLEPFVGAAGEEICPACSKDLSLFRADDCGTRAAVRPEYPQGESP